MKAIGALATLFLAVMAVQAGIAALIVLGMVYCVIGLIFNTKQTLEAIATLVGFLLLTSYPISFILILVIGAFFGLGNDKAKAGKPPRNKT